MGSLNLHVLHVYLWKTLLTPEADSGTYDSRCQVAIVLPPWQYRGFCSTTAKLAVGVSGRVAITSLHTSSTVPLVLAVCGDSHLTAVLSHTDSKTLLLQTVALHTVHTITVT